jgi:hypothetical protein
MTLGVTPGKETHVWRMRNGDPLMGMESSRDQVALVMAESVNDPNSRDVITTNRPACL